MKQFLSPELLAEWDYEKNSIRPEDVSTGSQKAVWWKCPQGHSYQSIVFTRSAGCGCPYCAGKRAIVGETDLATTNPELLPEWDSENELTPHDLTAGSHKQVWWTCEEGHRWQAAPYSRVRGSRCPYCTNRLVLAGYNDLASTDPAVADEWNYRMNGTLTPKDVTRGSNRKVWWHCKSGHVWQAAIFSRTRDRASGCPVCAGRAKAPKPLQTFEPRRRSRIVILPPEQFGAAIK